MAIIQRATIDDVPALVRLLNSGYRGQNSKLGWTTEADLISGEVRATEQMLRELIIEPGSVMLKHADAGNHITACVNLQQHEQKLYLGMLCVSPVLQGRGTGKQLLTAAEDYARQCNCNSIYMSVISVRTELVNWYLRHGYLLTGETKPFPEDPDMGKPTRALEFVILEKPV